MNSSPDKLYSHRDRGRKGGQSRSPAKVMAVRRNGQLGGRPPREGVRQLILWHETEQKIFA